MCVCVCVCVCVKHRRDFMVCRCRCRCKYIDAYHACMFVCLFICLFVCYVCVCKSPVYIIVYMFSSQKDVYINYTVEPLSWTQLISNCRVHTLSTAPLGGVWCIQTLSTSSWLQMGWGRVYCCRALSCESGAGLPMLVATLADSFSLIVWSREEEGEGEGGEG